MINKFFLLVVFLCILQACGESSTENDPPTLTFVSSNLDQYSELVPVPHTIGIIQIQVKENLKPSSLGSDTVHLMAGESHKPTDVDPTEDSQVVPTIPTDEKDITGANDSIEGRVWFDATTKTINFEPNKPLAQGTTYHIRIQNVELEDGRKVSVTPSTNGTDTGAIQFSFSTTHAHEVLRVRYDKDLNETSYVAFTVENNVLKERRQYTRQKALKLVLQYNAPLPSPSTRIAKLLYRNADNEITQYDYDVMENNVLIATVRFRDAGADLQWGTDDDLAVSWTERDQAHLNHNITLTHTLINRSEMVPWTGVNSPGFKLGTIYLEEHAGPNFEHRDIFYRDLGTNNEIDIDPTTQEITRIDDNISLWHKRDYIDGIRIRSWSIAGVGIGEGGDGMLFTGDDIATGLTTLEYYPNNGTPLDSQLKKLVTYYGKDFTFPLNEWLADEANNIVRQDAPVHSYRIFKYDDSGNRTEELNYSPGDDKIMASESELLSGLADDYLIQRKVYSTMPTIIGGSDIDLQ